MWNRNRNQVRKAEGGRGRIHSSLLTSRSSRRGVLLLVVLSMLVLFMLVGTAFLMSSNQSRIAMKQVAKGDRVGNYATKLLDRALLQIVRDTDNPVSVIRYHSLLRDLYGTDGFQGAVYGFRTGDSVDLGTTAGYSSRFAMATATQPRGPTEGQFIDLYFKKVTFTPGVTAPSSDDPQTKDDESSLTVPDLRHVVKLDRDPYGKLQLQTLPLTRGYYNGCLLTITSGSATGQSARILDYEYMGPIAGKIPVAVQIFRFRVMAFQRSDGQPLTISSSRSPEIEELAGKPSESKPPATFMVNGRAFSGTGVGYNPLAASGQPRLNALELFPIPFNQATNPVGANTTFIGAEIALLPNSVYFNPLDTYTPIAAAPQSAPDPFAIPLLGSPFGTYVGGKFSALNNNVLTPATSTFLYPNYVGPGGSNEGYDAADFQNMFLALQTVTPRSRGRIVQEAGAGGSLTLDIDDASVDRTKFLRLDLEDVPLPSFHRPDLINFWYHRLLAFLTGPPNNIDPHLAVKAIIQPYQVDGTPTPPINAQQAALIVAIKRSISLRPIRDDHPHFDGGNPFSVPDLTAMGASNLVRANNITVPIWETTGPWDVDNDNDGVRDSVWVDVGDPIQETEDGRRYKPLYAFLCVDLDSRLNVNAHGQIADLNPPYYLGSTLNPPLVGIIETPPGSGKYTATAGSIEAGLVVCNASPVYGPHPLANYSPGPNLAGSTISPTAITNSSQLMPRGLGYGPAEISLRPIFPIPWKDITGTLDLNGNRSELISASTGEPVDSYKSLLVGRERQDAVAVPGRYGYEPQVLPKGKPVDAVSPSINYEYTPYTAPGDPTPSYDARTPDLATQMKLFEYPWRLEQVSQASAFGTPPDLFGRYSVGINYSGQPFYDTVYDRNPNDKDPANLSSTRRINPSLLTGVPYSTNLSSSQRRDSWASRTDPASSMGFGTSLNQNDDATFSTTDLEKVLRATDADSGTLPPRLWDVVNDFDPLKLMDYDPNRIQGISNIAFGSTSQSALLATAQETASINRRLVTTDSSDLPVTTQTMPAYVSEFGADGVPGRRGQANQVLNAAGTDDFQAIMAARDGLPAAQTNLAVSRATAKITDLVYYRVWLEARRYEMNRQQLTEVAIDALSAANYTKFMNQINARVIRVYQTFPQLQSELLAPEVIAGKKMDLNRPFGNGKDDNGDGVVDDPLEAGEPFLDVNGNGKMDFNASGVALEPFIDLNGDGKYEGPGDVLWPQLAPVAVGGDGTLAEPITFDYTNGHEEPLHNTVRTQVANALGLTFAQVKGGVRNLDSQGRQLYARQLYCLALLLMDENYIAPWDEKDPQITKLLDATIAGSLAFRLRALMGPVPDPLPAVNQYDARTRAILLRKLTCRTIAQWAVNCVDMRDPDVIMTPFEYDENPWDGWGEWDDKWNADPTTWPTNLNDPASPTFLPLDGDPATNENDAWVLDWANKIPPVGTINDLAPNGGPRILKQLGVDPTKAVNLVLTVGPLNPPIVTSPFNQTRGIVWGAERPELLITETLAWHDRRTEDLKGDDTGKHDEMHVGDPPNPQFYPDIDMDQRLRPKGSLFVELYNPWSPDGQFPAELYTRLDGTQTKLPDGTFSQPYRPTATSGVDLSRLSNFGVRELFDTTPNPKAIPEKAALTLDASDGIVKRSPVWRLIVVDDWPRLRNRDRAKIGNGESQTGGSTTANGAQQFGGYSQRVGDAPPDTKAVLPTGATLAASGLPAYLTAELTDVEAWDVTKPLPYRMPDPDFDDAFNAAFTPTQVPQTDANHEFPNKFNVEYPYIEREFYFTTDSSPILRLSEANDWGQFVAPDSAAPSRIQTMDWNYGPKDFKLRIPDRYIKMTGLSHSEDRTKDAINPALNWARTQKFIPLSLEAQKSFSDVELKVNRTRQQPVIAPIQPGRYGVIGTAGTRYFKDPANQNIYTDPIGRQDLRTAGLGGTTGKNTDDDQLANSLRPPASPTTQQMRRIEIRPNSNPDLQQLVVASNGGDPKDQIQMGDTYDPFSTEIGRDNELIRNDTNNTIDNITTPDTTAGNVGGAKYYKPCVAIPVEGMSVSDPPWGWGPRETQAAGQELDIAQAKKREHDAQPGVPAWGDKTIASFDYRFDPRAANGEGAYRTGSGDASFDKPFDVAPELMRTGTTPNYRTTHLQRLANPELPWNPLPGTYTDAAGTDLYRPALPVNPYRTIDSSTVNLTAFNGTSSEEHNIGNNDGLAKEEGKLRPWERGGGAAGDENELLAYARGLRGIPDAINTTSSAKQVWSFKSVERGFWSRLSTSGWLPGTTAIPAPNPGVPLSQRMLWAQEPAMVDLRQVPLPTDPDAYAQLFDLIPGRQMTMRFDEVPQGQTDPPAKNQASFGNTIDDFGKKVLKSHCDVVLKHTLGFGNESFGLLYDRAGLKRSGKPINSPTSSIPPVPSAIGAPAPSRFIFPYDLDSRPTTGPGASPTGGQLWHDFDATKPEAVTINSTYPWLEWDNRPYVSAEELLNVPTTSQSQMMRRYTGVDPNVLTHPNPYGLESLGHKLTVPNPTPVTNATRWLAAQVPFGHLANLFAASVDVADLARDPITGALVPDTNGNPQPYGAPNLSRILDYVQVPSRYVGTDTMLNAETFNDATASTTYPTEPVGTDITDATDPRYNFQPPFNKVSRERDPGKVNLNTVTGRRLVDKTGVPRIWSDVFDGIMHRNKNPLTGAGDDNLIDSAGNTVELGHFGPAWRDVALSRRGYIQVDAAGALIDKPGVTAPPDTFQFGLNNHFPTLFANPFRSSDAGDLVPVLQMMQYGVDASMERVHPRNRGAIFSSAGVAVDYDSKFGNPSPPPTAFGDARDAGFGNDGVSYRALGTIPNDQLPPMPLVPPPPAIPPAITPTDVLNHRDSVPLFAESRSQSFADTNRNPYMMYEPMSRLNNLVTNRSGVYGVWITVGYFEVEKAPDWNDPDTTIQGNVRAHFGNDINLYNRAYPDGYMLGKELGSETGDVKRPRGFYIIDRTEEVGFKPGEDLNVEKTIRLRRRIE